MPKMKLSKSNIDKNAPLTEKGTVDYWDSGDGSIKGFGLRVGSQSRTFFVQVDVPAPATEGGKKFRTLKKIIGRYGELTPEQAKKKAAEEIKQLKETKPLSTGDSLTLAAMVEKYLAAKGLGKCTEDVYRKQLPAKFPGWMGMMLKDVAALQPDVCVGQPRARGLARCVRERLEKRGGRVARVRVEPLGGRHIHVEVAARDRCEGEGERGEPRHVQNAHCLC